jgi:hypothetical protein
MPRISVGTVVQAPAATVWRELADIARHVEWMADAETITFVGDQRQGAGTRFDCVTRIGPLRTNDRMEITSWVVETEIGVRHQGLVRGEGGFTIRPITPGQTDVSWSEELRFPWYLGGPITGLVAGPILRRIWQANLRRLARLCEGDGEGLAP